MLNGYELLVLEMLEQVGMCACLQMTTVPFLCKSPEESHSASPVRISRLP